ncbi:MAG TPA: tetratricopeptide repeat protein [Vicinamibacterales bacterium]|nr:tetratricopeptide repeat protein [Vicinamibacterales bacterium]
MSRRSLASRAAVVAVGLFALWASLAFAQTAAPDPAALVRQARKLNLEGKQDEAIATYREALMRAPDLYDAHYGLGIALDLTGAYGQARQSFMKAIQLAPDESKEQALSAMAVSYAFSGDGREASSFYRQVFDRQTAADNFSAAAETANALGRVYLETGDLDNAAKWYQTGYETTRRQKAMSSAQIDLADLRWAHAQARIAARRGNAATARAQVAEVTRLLDKGTNEEQRIQLPYLLGYVGLFLKDYAGAVTALRQADQQDPFVLFLLAQAQEKSGDAAGARELYEKVLASNAHSLNNAFARRTARSKLAATR